MPPDKEELGKLQKLGESVLDCFESRKLGRIMPKCVRKLIGNRRLWDPPAPGEEVWLSPDDLRADALRDLATDNNSLSIFEIGPQISVDRILAALGSNGAYIPVVDFVVFDLAILGELGISHERVNGATQDAAVNGQHLNLVQLTAKTLAEFGARIRVAGTVERYAKKHVVRLINQSVAQGFLDPNGLKPDVRKYVQN